MKTLIATCCAAFSSMCFGQTNSPIHTPAKPIPDEYFEVIRDSPNPTWGEFKNVLETASSCKAMKGRKPPLCEKTEDAMFSMLWQSLHRVMAGNVLAKGKGFARVCDTYAENLIHERKYGPQASYALLLVSQHMEAAKVMYAAPIGNTPLYRVLYNAMADEHLCKE